jgi:hypothetical protein
MRGVALAIALVLALATVRAATAQQTIEFVSLDAELRGGTK